jgi:hypothetical protein
MRLTKFLGGALALALIASTAIGATIVKNGDSIRWGFSNTDNIVVNEIDVTPPCVDASITVGAEAGDARAITIQLKDVNGNDCSGVQNIEAILYTSTAMTAFVVTGGSTGIAIGTDGALLALVAKKHFLLTSESDGDIDLTWTDTGTEAAVLGLKMPNGRVVLSAALTNA